MRQAAGSANSRYLVYTSAGDMNAIPLWLRGRRNFDLWVTYYGTKPQPYLDKADYRINRSGGKFQNLKTDWLASPDTFKQYDAIMVMDDDIVIDASGISRLFRLRDEYALTILQPAYLGRGKISYHVTKRRWRYKLRFTEFVEVSCPLFQKDALAKFLQEYDGKLAGWGIDFWFLDVLKREPNFRAAIIDAVTCINPHDTIKGGRREISSLQADDERMADWDRIKTRLRIKEADTRGESGGIHGSIFQFLIAGPWTACRRLMQLWWLRRHLSSRV